MIYIVNNCNNNRSLQEILNLSIQMTLIREFFILYLPEVAKRIAHGNTMKVIKFMIMARSVSWMFTIIIYHLQFINNLMVNTGV